ncbi:alpha-ketoglutarate-dependent dioxygenase AlkB [Streptomyces bohaiensis]|uniref:Alpha-ketoglutarate-dependent dioxygenase AlkB n=1 Tax=Streptomyces bohaiensis TaxID=1431344 RepID=A0ABX1CI49_9ACTN|nr:alpha-ketoglutarate-dependent dioxygenase AlkB [Streptomyces bohaiensis]NJQ16144.1 alpha-ketoglutarate-dependent dioxygenase AlkB [Streptomyces bohaiensis]
MDTGSQDQELFPRGPAVVAPGAVHLPVHLAAERQSELLAACRRWALPPAGLRTVRVRGGVMSVRQVGLGLHWYPYAYARTAVDGDGAPVKPFPEWLGEWARAAVRAATEVAAAAGGAGFGADPAPGEYDVALVNFYPEGARMGMHRDLEERSPAPVVSFSLGDACVFRFGNTESRGRPWRDTELRSGDAFVFGGPARLAYHAVPRTRPGTAPRALGLTGRVNVTVRVSGLDLANEREGGATAEQRPRCP